MSEKEIVIKANEFHGFVRKKLSKRKEIGIKANELHGFFRKNFSKRKIITLGNDDLWAANVIVLIIFMKIKMAVITKC